MWLKVERQLISQDMAIFGNKIRNVFVIGLSIGQESFFNQLHLLATVLFLSTFTWSFVILAVIWNIQNPIAYMERFEASEEWKNRYSLISFFLYMLWFNSIEAMMWIFDYVCSISMTPSTIAVASERDEINRKTLSVIVAFYAHSQFRQIQNELTANRKKITNGNQNDHKLNVWLVRATSIRRIFWLWQSLGKQKQKLFS